MIHIIMPQSLFFVLVLLGRRVVGGRGRVCVCGLEWDRVMISLCIFLVRGFFPLPPPIFFCHASFILVYINFIGFVVNAWCLSNESTVAVAMCMVWMWTCLWLVLLKGTKWLVNSSQFENFLFVDFSQKFIFCSGSCCFFISVYCYIKDCFHIQ